MVSFMEMLLILKNFRGNAIKLWRKIKSFRYHGAQRQCKLWQTSALAFCSFPCSPSNFIAGHFLSSKLSLLSISCCSLVVPSPPLRFVFFTHVARVNILPQNRLTLHSSFSVAVSLYPSWIPLRCIKYLKLGINCVNRIDNLLFWLYFVSWTYSVQFLFQFEGNFCNLCWPLSTSAFVLVLFLVFMTC